jgi:hypothetical protein
LIEANPALHSKGMEPARITSFADILRKVADRPALNLAPDEDGGCESLRSLFSFILGYEMGRSFHEYDTSILKDFTAWVCHRYGVDEGPRNWYGHILERAGGDEVAAFQLFRRHFEEYLRDLETVGPSEIRARYAAMLKQLRKHENG